MVEKHFQFIKYLMPARIYYVSKLPCDGINGDYRLILRPPGIGDEQPLNAANFRTQKNKYRVLLKQS